MDKIYKWGIIGPGRIAQKFAAALKLVPGAVLHAVASRDIDKAKQFADKYNAPVAYGSYEEMANDDEIDAVYIATPHSFHHAHALLCFQKKKAVLCEKPMSVNFASTAEMVLAAREHDTFLMEAMWSRFLPTIEKTKELVDAGEIGELKYLGADFGFAAPFNPGSRLFDLKLGGGSLLDVGIYPLFLALFILGKPDEIKSFSQLASTGADETSNVMLYYNKGIMANILSSLTVQTPITAEISGTKGTIFLDKPWYKGSTIRIERPNQSIETISLPYGDNGFEFQVQEVQNCLAEGLKESSKMPLSFSLLLADVMDDITRMGNISYQAQL